MKPLFQQIWQGDSVEHCQRFKAGSVNCIVTDPPFRSQQPVQHGRYCFWQGVREEDCQR